MKAQKSILGVFITCVLLTMATTLHAVLASDRLQESSFNRWMKDPLDVPLVIAVTNLCADTGSYMEVKIGDQSRVFYGAGLDDLGNYIPTNYAPVSLKVVLQREYPLSITCTNSGPSGSSLFKLDDFPGSTPEEFTALLTPTNAAPVSAFLWSSFSSSGRFNLTNVNSSLELKQTNLVQELNRVLRGPSIYTTARFVGVTKRQETQDLLNQPNLSGQALLHLNRLLLEDAYDSYGTFALAHCGVDNSSGTAEVVFDIRPPTELNFKEVAYANAFTILKDREILDLGTTVYLEHPPEGNISTNCGVIEVEKRSLHWAVADGCDDPTPAAGDGKWLDMGPGGDGDTNRIALDWSVSLGRLYDGLAAGRLRIRQAGVTAKIYTPACIYYNAASTNVRNQVELVSTNGDGTLRQIKSSQTFVDIVPNSTNQTTMNFYLPTQVGTNRNQFGIYTNISGNPFVSWWVQNPEPATTNKLLIVETRNGTSSTNSLVRTVVGGGVTWTLTRGVGNDLRTETREVSFASSPASTNRVELNTVRDAANNIVYRCRETYKLHGWGWEVAEKLVDPDGAQLKTTYVYYDYDSDNPIDNEQLKAIFYPDGSWEKREYPDQYELESSGKFAFHLLRPWGDTPATPETIDGITHRDDSCSNCMVTAIDAGTYDQYETEGVGPCDEARNLPLNIIRSSIHESTALEDYDSTDAGISSREGLNTGYYRMRYPDYMGYGFAGHVHFKGDVLNSYNYGQTTSCYNEWGTYNPSSHSFTNEITGVTNNWRTVSFFGGWTPGTYYFDHIDGQDIYFNDLRTNFSTKQVSIYTNGNLVQGETWLFTGVNSNAEPEFAILEMLLYSSDSLGHTTNIVRVDPVTQAQRTIYSADWRGGKTFDGDLKYSETDEFGVTTLYAYDSLKRLVSTTKAGTTGGAYPAQSDIVTSYRYDANGGKLRETVSGGGLALTNQYFFDAAGRMRTNISPANLVTKYDYSSGGLVQIVTYPGTGISKVTTKYLDGRLKSVTGSAVVSEYHTYGLNTSWPLSFIRLLETNRTGTAISPRCKIVGYDAPGRVVYEETYALAATNVSIHVYSGKATICGDSGDYDNTNGFYRFPHYIYHAHTSGVIYGGILYSQGDSTEIELDDQTAGTSGHAVLISDQPGVIDCSLNSLNRISLDSIFYENDGTGWFKTTQTETFPTDNSSQRTLVRATKERISGFTAGVQAQTISLDAHTNATITTVSVNRGAKTVTTTMDTAQSGLNATSIACNGLLETESTTTVTPPTRYYYDSLGRLTSMVNPLGATALINYNSATGQTNSVTDFTGRATTYTYYQSGDMFAGKIKSTANAGKTTYYDYDTQGRVRRIWGNVPYPQEMVYDDILGDLTELHTYRGGLNWNGTTWSANPGTNDVTHWYYDAKSGMLTNKTDASGASVSYSGGYFGTNAAFGGFYYTTRKWARTPVISTTNVFNWAGDLVGTLYSDNTSVLYTNYNRSGSPRQITDNFGVHVFAYDYANRPLAETCANITVTNHYHPIYGRDQVNVAGTSSTLITSYGYDGYGRLGSVTCGSDSAVYSYTPNSDLLQSTAFSNNVMGSVLTTTRTWDYGVRLRSVANIVNNAPITSHNYEYDALNRRTRATLEDGSYWQYGYNDRNELTDAHHYWSYFSTDTPVAGQQFGYGYDNVGNRQSASFGGDTVGANLRNIGYIANNLNQYTSITNPGYVHIMGAALATNSVTVNSGTTDRHGEYYHRELGVTSASGPTWQNVTNISGSFTQTGGLIVPGNSQALTYDLDGNLTNDGIWTYEWDGENRLKGLTMNSSSGIPDTNRLQLTFIYDYLGRRVQKVVKKWNAGQFANPVTNQYVYDGWNLLAVINPQRTVLQSFVWGNDLSGTPTRAGGVGGLLMANISGTNNFACYDGNGNLTALVAAATKIVTARYEYSPFGELIRATGLLARQQPFRFSTKFWDEESGLIYYGYRYYSPSQGRWIGRDPTTDQIFLNLYLFCHNNALNRFDIDGRADAGDLAMTTGIQGLLGGLIGGGMNLWTGSGTFLEGFQNGFLAGAIGGFIGKGFTMLGWATGEANAVGAGVRMVAAGLNGSIASTISIGLQSGDWSKLKTVSGAATVLGTGAFAAVCGGAITSEKAFDILLDVAGTGGVAAANGYLGGFINAEDAVKRLGIQIQQDRSEWGL